MTDKIEIVGVDPDEIPLQVRGASSQVKPLQTWEDSSGDPLVQITSDGRLELGDLDMGTPDALIEANNDVTLPTSVPLRGIQSQGLVQGTVSNAIAWTVHELELLGSGGVSGVHTTLRGKISQKNTGDADQADLRASDFEAINEAGSSQTPVGQLTGVQSTVTNEQDAYLEKAVGVGVAIHDEGTLQEAYGVQIGDVDQGTEANYAIHTGKGAIHLGDDLELKVRDTAPSTNPPTDYIRIYPRTEDGHPQLFAKDASGDEYALSGNGQPFNARLTLAQGDPLHELNSVLAAETVYLTPYLGNCITLFDGTLWIPHTLSEISIRLTDAQTGDTTNGSPIITNLTDTSQFIVGLEVTGSGIPASTTISSIDSPTQITLSANASATATGVSLTFEVSADTNLDIFCYANAGAPKLEMAKWISDQARASALTMQDGIYVWDGKETHRYIGTIRTTDTAGQCEDSSAHRFCWNYYNRVPKSLYVEDGEHQHSYTVETMRDWYEISVMVDFVTGITDQMHLFTIQSRIAGGGWAYLAVGGTPYIPQFNGTSQYIHTSTTRPVNFVAGYEFVNAKEYGTQGAYFAYVALEGMLWG